MKLKFRVIEDGTKILSEPSFNELRESLTPRKDLFESSNKFFDFYIEYVNNKISTYLSTEECLKNIFIEEIDGEKYEKMLKSLLQVSKEYVEHIKNCINKNNIDRYRNIISELRIDLEELLLRWHNFDEEEENLRLSAWRNKYLSSTDIKFNINSLFFIEDIENIEDLSFRDIKPISIFQIRQLLEIYIQEKIRYYGFIYEKNQKPVKSHTKIGWSFLKKEIEENKNRRINLGFDIDIIDKINKWTNTFVHLGYIHNSSIIYLVIKYIAKLFEQDSEIKISKDMYEELKKDFEKYVNEEINKNKQRKKKIIVRWYE